MKLSGAAIGDVTIATTNADGSMRSLSAILADCRVVFGGMTGGREGEQCGGTGRKRMPCQVSWH